LVYGVCLVFIVASLAVIAWRVLRLRSGGLGARVVSQEAVSALLSQPLPINENRTLRLSDSRADYLVVFLFTPSDCAACLPELHDLSRLVREKKNLDAVAVMGFSNPAEALQTKENFDLEIPIVQDANGELIKAIDPPRTPWKLVIRRMDQKLLFESPPTVGEKERWEFLDKLRRLSKGTERAGAG
jgi:hypothetical protein